VFVDGWGHVRGGIIVITYIIIIIIIIVYKVPAAFCRKAVVSTSEFEVWGDGKQTRSFMFIDDCVEGRVLSD
jgi:hypothetical protein